MIALEKAAFLGIDEYLAGEERSEVKHEYLGGTVHAMSGGTGNHSAIAVNFSISVGGQLRGKPCRVFNSDFKVRIDLADHTRFYYPDAQVVCHPGEGTRQYEERPTIVLEVLSPSTRRTDLMEKKAAYLSIAPLKVLILADSETLGVDVYRRSSNGGFGKEPFTSRGDVIPLPEIDAVLPLADLYEGVEFPPVAPAGPYGSPAG